MNQTFSLPLSQFCYCLCVFYFFLGCFFIVCKHLLCFGSLYFLHFCIGKAVSSCLAALKLLFLQLFFFFLQVFIAISLILGDGLYNLIKIIAITVKEMWNRSTKDSKLPFVNDIQGEDTCSFVICEILMNL